MSTCYIINFYLGNRRNTVSEYNNVDRLCFVKKQVELLEKYTHNLSKIVFSFNVEPDHYDYLTDVFILVPKFIQGAPVEIYIRKNYGMSYGAWSDAYIKNKDKYDYYIFNEDDYFFVQNNWDRYLVNKFNSYQDAGYVCAVLREPNRWNYYKKHFAHATSISSNTVLSKIVEKYGCLPHSSEIDYKSNEINGQIEQSFSVLELGYNIYDVRDDYRVAFAWTGEDGIDIHRFFWWNEKDLIVPALILNDIPYMWYECWDEEFIKGYVPTTREEALNCYYTKQTIHENRKL